MKDGGNGRRKEQNGEMRNVKTRKEKGRGSKEREGEGKRKE